jgi:hypothetical protein
MSAAIFFYFLPFLSSSPFSFSVLLIVFLNMMLMVQARGLLDGRW